MAIPNRTKPNHTKSIIIIGTGMAGLSAGCYAQMNGYRSQIFELHTIPGGLCTSWRRHGYLFDGGVRYLVGTGPQARAYPMWQELGVLPGREIYHYNEFICVEDEHGRAFHLYTDIDRLERHMLSRPSRSRGHLPIYQRCARLQHLRLAARSHP